MPELQIISPKENFFLVLGDDGKFRTHNSFVFRVKVGATERRLVVPAGARVVKAASKRCRARLVRDMLLSDPYRFSRRDADDAFAAALLQDGVAPWKVKVQRRWLRVAGRLRNPIAYGARRTPAFVKKT